MSLEPLVAVEAARSRLSTQIEERVAAIAEQLTSSEEWKAIRPKHRNTDVRLAFGVLQTTFFGGGPVTPTSSSVEFGSHHVDLGGDGHPVVERLELVRRQLLLDGNPFEPALTAFLERLVAWRDLLWFPYEVGVDAPDPGAGRGDDED